MALTKGMQRTVALPMYDEAAPDNLLTGLTLTCTVSLDGAPFDPATNAADELGTTGVYTLVLTAAEMDADLLVVKVTAAGACDQVLTVVTDELASVKAKTDTIGALAVTISSPVASSGEITLYQGDDYSADDSRAITATVAVADVPSLTGATVVLKCSEATWEATACSSDGTDWTITFEPTAEDTAAITLARQSYELEAELDTSEHIVTLATGTLVRIADIPALPAAP